MLRADPYSAHQWVIRQCRGAREVLDVGGSAGTIARELRGGATAVDIIEIDAQAAAVAQAVGRQVLAGDVETMPLPLELAAYDAIILADLIEHLRDPIATMARLRPYLAPAGRLLITTPNIANWSMRLLHLAGRWDYTDRGIMDRTHLRFFTRRTLLAAIRAAGYRVVDVDVTCPLPALRREPFNRWAHWLGRRWPTMLAYQFLVVATAT
ncbi:MAG: class I SAM-dependent methyltransferase [Chloroflexi bacterium]|nr:MAG: class I SAM-dependent methyltransferase [Chloroflexota bacterium]